MEYVTIHELARMSGVSTATIRLDIKSGKIPIAAPGKRGRGNPTRIRLTDLESTDRIQYQQLARRILQGAPLTGNEREKEKFTVNELALRTGLSPQVVRKDIVDGKLKAEGGGRRGSPYYVFLDSLANASRVEYRRLIENIPSADDECRKEIEQEVAKLKREIQYLKDKLHEFESRFEIAASGGSKPALAASPKSASRPDFHDHIPARVEVASIVLPKVFQGYYINEEKLKLLKTQAQNGEPLEPIQVRKLDNGQYVLRRGIGQYHVAQELGLEWLTAYVESSED